MKRSPIKRKRRRAHRGPVPADEKLLDTFRGRYCEWGLCLLIGEPHHLRSKGLGGWARADLPENLVTLCRFHHNMNHAGHSPTDAELLTLVATREGTTAAAITEKMDLLLRQRR